MTLAELCVQFWSVFQEQYYIVLLNSIQWKKVKILLIRYVRNDEARDFTSSFVPSFFIPLLVPLFNPSVVNTDIVTLYLMLSNGFDKK